VALVFTKDVGPEAQKRRMKMIKEASLACWEGRWSTDTGWQPPVDGGSRTAGGTTPSPSSPPTSSTCAPGARDLTLSNH
jgi:hypothetical protein